MDNITAEEAEVKLKEFQEWIRHRSELPQNIGILTKLLSFASN